MLTREQVYAQLTKEDEYAGRWSKGKHSRVDGIPDHMVSRKSGQPWTEMEWLNFAQAYLDDARAAHVGFAPDSGAIRIRLIKAASLLVSALQVHGEAGDLERLAGQSSNDFPIIPKGISVFNALSDEKGCLIQPIGKLRQDGGECDKTV